MPDTKRFDYKDVIVELKETVYQGYFRIDRYQLNHPLYAGGRGQTLSREVFERGQVGALLPYDPYRDEVVLIEQFRPGPYAAGEPCWLIETVAGILEKGESPEQLVRRETLEEAGCEVQDLEHVMRFFVSPGASSEAVDLYCGKVDAGNAGGLHGLEDEGEDIRVLVLTRQTALQWLQQGRIVNAKTIIALQWLASNWQRLQQQWTG